MDDEEIVFDPSIADEFGTMGLSDTFMGIPLIDEPSVWMLLMRFGFNLLVTWIVIHFFYFKKERRRDYYFTFMLFSVTIFLLIYILGSVKMQIGLVLGLFGIFGIIRYRTEQISIREMTYLFVTMGISVINGLATNASYAELFIANAFFILIIYVLEYNKFLKHTATKLIIYERIDLIKPDKEVEMIADLKERTGLDIVKVQVGHIDFLRDVAFLKVYYTPTDSGVNEVDQITKVNQFSESK